MKAICENKQKKNQSTLIKKKSPIKEVNLSWIPRKIEMSAAAVARQTSTTQAAEDEEETSFVDLEVITKHGITKTDINKFKEAGFHTVSWSKPIQQSFRGDRNQSINYVI